MTDILDLPSWSVLSTKQIGGEYVIEAEFAAHPETCPKCGVVDVPYRHGIKPIKVTRRNPQVREALLHKYECRCQSCLGVFDPQELYVTRMGVVLEDEPLTNMTLLCGTCKVRFHTDGAKHGSSLSTP